MYVNRLAIVLGHRSCYPAYNSIENICCQLHAVHRSNFTPDVTLIAIPILLYNYSSLWHLLFQCTPKCFKTTRHGHIVLFIILHSYFVICIIESLLNNNQAPVSMVHKRQESTSTDANVRLFGMTHVKCVLHAQDHIYQFKFLYSLTKQYLRDSKHLMIICH